MKLVLTGLIGLLVAGSALGANVATVNGKDFSEKEFKMAIENIGPSGAMVAKDPALRERFLNHLIDSRLMAEMARKNGVHKTDSFRAKLAAATEQILASIYTDEYIKEQTKESNLKKYFDANKGKFAKAEVKAAHILVKEEAEAKKILKLATAKGADFGALAKKHSTGPSGPSGGDLGWFGKGRMVPEFEKAAFSTKKGQVHPQPVKTQFGWHIIRVNDVKSPEKVTFEQSKKEVEQEITRNARKDLSDKLRKEAKVKVNSDAVKNMKL